MESDEETKKKVVIIFSPMTCNLAETTRAIEIAKILKTNDKFDILFLSYGGDYEDLITKESFKLRKLEPRLTAEKIEHIYKVDQGEKIGYFFSISEVEEQVCSELKVFDEVKPSAVVTGFNFSCSVSARCFGTSLVWLTHSTWNINSLISQGLLEPPDLLDKPVLRSLPDRLLLLMTKAGTHIINRITHPYDVALSKRGLAKIGKMEKLWEGDFNLLAEPEGFCEISVPSNYIFIGPLIGKLDLPIPDEIEEVIAKQQSADDPVPLIFFAMGSSGQPKVIAKILEGFRGQVWHVISPMKKLLSEEKVDVPPNVTLTDWIPAHKVNPLCDLSVIHGGIGTTFTALIAGKPIVGIAMQPEQEANIDCVVRKGFAIRIKKPRLNAKTLNSAIKTLLDDATAQEKAEEYGVTVREWVDNSPSLILSFFQEHYL